MAAPEENSAPGARRVPRLEDVGFRAALEWMPDAVVIVGRTGRIVEANARAEGLFGRRREHLLGSPLDMLIPAATRHDHARHLQSYFAAPHSRPMGTSLHITGLRKGGKEFPADVSLSPLETDEGIYAIAAIRDMTDRQRLERQFYHAQRLTAAGRLLAGVAHDFNNHLTGMMGFAEVALRALPAESAARTDLEELRRCARQLADISRQLLSFAGNRPAEPVCLNLNDSIRNIERLLRRFIGQGLRLEINLSPDLAPVRIDPAQIEQVLANLVINARDAMPGGGTIRIDTSNDPAGAGEVTVSIIDAGVGMTDEVKARVFEPFFSTKEKGRGSGLGLATCRDIVERHQGRIEIETTPGEGTTVRIRLPRATGAGDSGSQRLLHPQSLVGAETLLMVDDHAVLLNVFSRALSDLGYTVRTAPNPEEAMSIARNHAGDIHLLITDVVMPQTDGVALADAIKRIRPAIKILFMSGDVDAIFGPFRVTAKEPPADAPLLPKPFRPEDMARKIREVLDR